MSRCQRTRSSWWGVRREYGPAECFFTAYTATRLLAENYWGRFDRLGKGKGTVHDSTCSSLYAKRLLVCFASRFLVYARGCTLKLYQYMIIKLRVTEITTSRVDPWKDGYLFLSRVTRSATGLAKGRPPSVWALEGRGASLAATACETWSRRR